MKKQLLLALALLLGPWLMAQVPFDQYFELQSLRLDYQHAGNAQQSVIYFEGIKREPFWGGSMTQLIDPMNYGTYRVVVYDSASGRLLYTRGYSTLFHEWQDTPEAKRLQRSFFENVVVPWPKASIRLVIEERQADLSFAPKFELDIDPSGYFIDPQVRYPYSVEPLEVNGPSATCLDIVVLPEGYTEAEMAKFRADAKRFVGYFFEVEPFASARKKVNFRLVMAPSIESGTDVPGERIWRKTLLDTHFYTFHSERYLTTRDMRAVRDVAALVPYDQIYILVNTSRYGGGGIFNYYNLCVSDHPQSREVFTHEFGHAFAALADEYAYDDTPADSLYNMRIELWEPNLTNLVNFDKKWAKLLAPGTPIPTADTSSFGIGAFEGGGYAKRGVYRPERDCKMRSNQQNSFCRVCLQSVEAMLNLYTK